MDKEKVKQGLKDYVKHKQSGELKFEYNCNFCGKHITMNTRDIINLIERQSKELSIDEIEAFFTPYGKQYNLCPRCARDEGFEVEDFEGSED